MKALLAMAVVAAAALPVAGRAATHTITIDGMRFRPAAVTVARGDTVVWVNRDLVPHTATAPGRFDSGPIAAGAHWSWRVKTPGDLRYRCTFHPGMEAALQAR